MEGQISGSSKTLKNSFSFFFSRSKPPNFEQNHICRVHMGTGTCSLTYDAIYILGDGVFWDIDAISAKPSTCQPLTF